ncbi:pyridoxal kinase PdxY [Psittacicella hinzii]|uniref:pyridoxal kinase n=1 Tax=Psittacicella hinzii TaxID=2028575 RepID=A0A3A1YJT9_9GAMM|nr:pyridoxal kinase PdxY [Psittacicella hinzii]RIY38452.1 pyridoxal kinase [Psittacicella hinzii]
MKNVLAIQSHVVYGYAGNKAATLPMQLCGVDVWPLNTVQFSTSTRYPKFAGPVTTNEDLVKIVQTLADPQVDLLKRVDAVLSGYLGSAEQVDAILEIVDTVREQNPDAVYLLDPVMGKAGKGCIVAPGVAEAIRSKAVSRANITCPNLEELQILHGSELKTFADAVNATIELAKRGPTIVMVKHLHRCARQEGEFESLLYDHNTGKLYHLTRPLVDLPRDPVGAGDMLTGILLACLLTGSSALEAFEHCQNAVYKVVLKAKEMGELELQPVAVRREIMDPPLDYRAVELNPQDFVAKHKAL